MPEAARQAAIQMAEFVIERHLASSFAQLDAGTADVTARKHLYAGFVERALVMASERLPDPDWWGQVADRMAARHIGGQASAVASGAPSRGH